MHQKSPNAHLWFQVGTAFQHQPYLKVNTCIQKGDQPIVKTRAMFALTKEVKITNDCKMTTLNAKILTFSEESLSLAPAQVVLSHNLSTALCMDENRHNTISFFSICLFPIGVAVLHVSTSFTTTLPTAEKSASH